MTETWYLLYSGSSDDGRGESEYVGRTRNASDAAKHFRKSIKNPYSIGYVAVITDEEVVKYYSWGRDYNPVISELKEVIQQLEENSND